MTIRLRLISVALALALPLIALLQWHLRVGSEGAPLSRLVLPDRVEAWALAREEQISPEVFAVLQPDLHVSRIYGADGRVPILLYVGLYAGRATYGKGAHNPEICYPSAGWEVVESRPVEVPLADGSLIARYMRAQRGGAHQEVLYWFQPAGRWPRGEAAEQLLRILDAVAGRPQYAFVRIAAPALAGASLERDLLSFAAEVGSPVRAALEAGHASAPGRPELGLTGPYAAPDRRERKQRLLLPSQSLVGGAS